MFAAIYIKKIASVVGQIILMNPSFENVTQVVTRNL